VVTFTDLDEDDTQIEMEVPNEIRYLFTTKTCPNCKLAKGYLTNVPYIPVDAEENRELALKYKVRQAPTLVVVNGDESRKIVNASNIKKYAEETVLTTM
jgi:ribonucleoside-triphosphate reductase